MIDENGDIKGEDSTHKDPKKSGSSKIGKQYGLSKAPIKDSKRPKKGESANMATSPTVTPTNPPTLNPVTQAPTEIPVTKEPTVSPTMTPSAAPVCPVQTTQSAGAYWYIDSSDESISCTDVCAGNPAVGGATCVEAVFSVVASDLTAITAAVATISCPHPLTTPPFSFDTNPGNPYPFYPWIAPSLVIYYGPGAGTCAGKPNIGARLCPCSA